MERWNGHYSDNNHDVDVVIENHYDDDEAEASLYMCIDGISFWGVGFDDWELPADASAEVIRLASERFSFFKYGSREKGYRYMLQEFTLTVTIPSPAVVVESGESVPAEIVFTFESDAVNRTGGSYYQLDDEKVRPGESVWTDFRFIVNAETFVCSKTDGFFETSLIDICRQFGGRYYMKNCFGCLYSDYSPYGQGNIGSMLCFRDVAAQYLKVNGKYNEKLNEGECTIWDVMNHAQCRQETGLCEQFRPRVDCIGGYRGLIY